MTDTTTTDSNVPATLDATINKSPSARVRVFNQPPYYDDFNENKNFVRILFRPKLSVQTREINQLQTMLQDQIGIISDAMVGNKTSVIGGKPNFNKNLNYIKLAKGVVFSRPLIDYQESTFICDNGITGKISFAIPENSEDPATLYVQYLTASPATGRTVPEAGTNITVTFADNNQEVISISESPNYIGLGSAIVLDEGIFYIKKTFVRVPSQILIIKKYGIEQTDPDFIIGLLIKETIVTPEMDFSLLDNATGTPNETAPGAHRLQMTGLLIKKSDVPEEEMENFISLIRIEKNEVAQKPREESDVLPSILALLARRTNDESGDYVVDTFDMDIREHLLTGVTQDPVDVNGTNTQSEDAKITISDTGVYTLEEGGKEDLLCLQFDPGVAYVRGWEVRIPGITRIACPKARETADINSTIVQVNYTNSVTLEPKTGDITIGEKLIFKNNIDSPIGSGFVIGVKALLDNKIKVYLSNINFNIGQSFGQVVNIATSGDEQSIVAFSAKYISSDINNLNSSLVYKLPQGMAKTVQPYVHQFYKSFTVQTNGSEIVIANEDFNEQMSTDPSDYYVYIQNEKSGQPASVITLSQNSAKLNISNLKTGTTNVNAKIITKIFSSAPTIKTKKLFGLDGSYTEQKSSNDLKNRKIILNKSDGYRLLKVISSNGSVITSKFLFDGGQRDAYYDRASINLIPGQSLEPNDTLTVVYAFFNHSTSGDFFCTDSYTDLEYSKIPNYITSSGESIFLGAAIDFRPRINDASTLIDIVNRGLVVPNEQLIAKVTYYLPRKDRVMVTAAGNIVLVKGQASFNPQLPSELKDAITIYALSLAPYTFSINSVKSEKMNHKRYTMKDIGKLETRLTNVEEVTLMNKLESDTASINFDDRFKSGYIVDNFSTSNTSDIADINYGVAKDLLDPMARPKIISDFVDMDYYSSASQDIRYHPNTGLITLDYEVVEFVSQDLASTMTKIQPLINYGYGTGTVTLNPAFDVWREEYSRTQQIYTSTTNSLDDIIINNTPSSPSNIEGAMNNLRTTVPNLNLSSTVNNQSRRGGVFRRLFRRLF